MKMTCEFNLVKLNASAYKKDANKDLIEKLKNAVAFWIQTAISLIPVWSGASHGTFIKLAGKIGQTFSVSGGNGFPGMLGPAYGSQQSQGRITTWGGAYIAEYSTTLWHLIYNEYNNANLNPREGRVFSRLLHPGPYNFQAAANEAFRAHIQDIQMLSPWNYITLIPKKV
jgi:hypothetical protein